jgi:prevent-host-death family protein
MQKVGSREFKNRMGKYLSAVRRGQSLVITDRGRPVAKVSPPDAEDQQSKELEARLQELEGRGSIHRGTWPMGKFKAVPSRGKPASQMILEDRR